MRRLLFFSLFTIFTRLAFAQLDSNSITVTAARPIAAGQPDQAVYGVQVQSGLDKSLDDVIAALQGTGITVVNFTGLLAPFLYVGTGLPAPAPMLTWTFRFATPLTKIKDTVTMLTALQQSLAKKNNGLTLSFTVEGTQVSAQSQPLCSLPDLVADARAQAQKLADASGGTVGNILALSGATPGASLGLVQAASLGALIAPLPVPSSCSMTIKFVLSRF